MLMNMKDILAVAKENKFALPAFNISDYSMFLGIMDICEETDSPVIIDENGNSLIIHATDNNKKNMYIQTMNLNGTEYKKNYLRHEDLLKGGNINFQMGSQPNLNRGTEEESFPYSFSKVLKKIR